MMRKRSDVEQEGERLGLVGIAENKWNSQYDK